MSQILEISQLIPLLDKDDLSMYNIFLSNKLVIDIFDYSKSKGISQGHIVSWFSQIAKGEVNGNSLITRIYQIKKNASKKRGVQKTKFLSDTFNIPMNDKLEKKSKSNDQTYKVVSENIAKELHATKRKYEEEVMNSEKKESEILESKKMKITQDKIIKKLRTDIESKNRSIKLKSNFIENFKTSKKSSEVQARRHKKKWLDVKTELKSCIEKNNDQIKEYQNLKLENLALKAEIDSLKSKLSLKISEVEDSTKTIANLKTEVHDTSNNCDYLQTLLDDNKNVNIYDENSRSYTTEFRQTVMSLTSLNVATNNVSSVINESLKLAGRSLSVIPSRQTIDNIVAEKVLVSQKQVGLQLKDKKNTSLYSDETRKFGKTYNSFLISDENKNVYLLGMREMCNKSSSTTLDTFKEILSDVSNVCDATLENNDISTGYNIVCNIRDFMSDRAKTNISFTNLLVEYRKEILPEVIGGWDLLTEEEQNVCAKVNNFFCGLHLLVNFAECATPVLKEFEALHTIESENFEEFENEFDRDDEPSFSKFDAKFLNFVRFLSKCFAKGVDEKCGCFSDFYTYCLSKNEKNHFISFRGNRFNVIFLMAEFAYYHRDHVKDFLSNVHGANNFIQKAALSLSKSSIVLAECKVLGLISKCVTAPLWRLIEQNVHVLDMNIHYESLLEFFKVQSQDASPFINGEAFPFSEELVHKDKFYESLLACNEKVDSIAVQVAQNLFLCFYELLKTAMKEQLPGGNFYEPSPNLVNETLSVIPHNKLPERAFGMLDFMVRYRPNASVLTNEAFLMFSFNKTSEWLESLPGDEKTKLLTEARENRKSLQEKFRNRCKEIEQKRKITLQEKQASLLRRKENLYKKKENQTADIIYYGLWQNTNLVDTMLLSIQKQSEKKKALISQLRFRQNVLKQHYKDKSIFNATQKGKQLNVEQLTANVKKLIEAASSSNLQEVRANRMPLLVGKKIKHTFSNDQTYTGKVISTVPGFPSFYNVIYDNELNDKGEVCDKTAIYTYRLMDDYRAKKLEIIPEVLSK